MSRPGNLATMRPGPPWGDRTALPGTTRFAAGAEAHLTGELAVCADDPMELELFSRACRTFCPNAVIQSQCDKVDRIGRLNRLSIPQQVASVPQVRGREALGEPIMDRCQELSRFVVAAL